MNWLGRWSNGEVTTWLSEGSKEVAVTKDNEGEDGGRFSKVMGKKRVVGIGSISNKNWFLKRMVLVIW